MSAIQKSITIDADAAAVYDALATPDGYRGWWCRNSAIADWEGGQSMLHFVKDGQPVTMTFRVDELAPSTGVRWTCVSNDAPPWIGTQLAWSVKSASAGVEVALEHSGWSDAPHEAVAQGWDHFMASLKQFVETGEGQPW